MSNIIRSYRRATTPPEDGKEGFYPVHHCMDYVVSNHGRIKNAFTHEIVQPKKSSDGSLVVSLFTHDRYQNYKVHDIVARAFVEHPAGDLRWWCVQHVDGNVRNNNASNLRWAPLQTSGPNVEAEQMVCRWGLDEDVEACSVHDISDIFSVS